MPNITVKKVTDNLILNTVSIEQSSFEVSIEQSNDLRKGLHVYIDTERFKAQSISIDNGAKNYDQLSDDYKNLHEVTFNNPSVVAKFGDGNIWNAERYFKLINTASQRWSKEYQFAGFSVIEKESDENVGYQVLGNSDYSNASELAYLFAQKFHNAGHSNNIGIKTYRGVGTEVVGALVNGWGQHLYEDEARVNVKFNENFTKLDNGQEFRQIYATCRPDNGASSALLKKFGFNTNEIIVSKSYGERYEYFKSFHTIEEQALNSLSHITLNQDYENLNTLGSTE